MLNNFFIINENNVRYNLKNIDKAIVPSVSGIGYEYNKSYVRVGNVYKLDKTEIQQGSFAGTVIFKKYEEYQRFVSFIEGSDDLRIIYKPIDIEYFRDVEFVGITNVINHGDHTECELMLDCKGLYYTEDSKRFVVEDVEGESRYPLPMPFTFNDYSNIAIDYDNKGHSDGEIIAELFGYMDRPTIELYRNGVLKYKVAFDVVVEEGQKLLYSAKDGDNYVVLEDVDGLQTNVVGCLTLENDNFFKIPKGRNILKVTSESGVLNRVVFRILTAYKGV